MKRRDAERLVLPPYVGAPDQAARRALLERRRRARAFLAERGISAVKSLRARSDT